MKIHTLLLIICLLLTSSLLYSQEKLRGIGRTSLHKTPVITKGYYAIFNNAGKLNFRTADDPGPQLNNAGTITKGYFSIKGNAGKLTKGDTNAIRSYGRFPFREVRKGYFSIGKNAEKLQ